VPTALIKEIKSTLPSPVIVGGGIRSVEAVSDMQQAGANVIVIGNKIEEDIDFLLDLRSFIRGDVSTPNPNL
jgi:putative glycerol-1-phosphate prenyltransferase